MTNGRLKPANFDRYNSLPISATKVGRQSDAGNPWLFFLPSEKNSKEEPMRKSMTMWAAVLILMMSGPVWGHFGMLIPSQATVSQADPKTVDLQISFSHPFEMAGMDMAKPKAFGVMAGGSKEDLLGTLKPARVMGKAAWSSQYNLKKPGVYTFYVEPEPYWEPAEDCFIVHYTKVVVPAFGDEEDWDKEVGLKIEIVPLARPYGLYAGNVFQGIVKVDGRPLPFAEVEVEFYNKDRKASAPNEYMVTQVVKTDRNGVLAYAAPKAGWWGFAALTAADFKLKKDGKDKAVEIGGVIWVYFQDWQMKK
jgi:cobalt/nickel transport protein